MDHVVVDVEIAKTIEETPGGWDSTHLLGVSVACVWQYSDQRMRVYGPDDVLALRDRLLRADCISGFNIWNFDFPLIWGQSKQQWLPSDDLRPTILQANLAPKTDDVLRRIWQALGLDPDRYVKETHGGWGLDAVAGATLHVRKIGYGGDAPKWFQAGQIQRVVNYCADDVAIERDLCDFIDRYGYIVGNESRVVQISPWKPER